MFAAPAATEADFDDFPSLSGPNPNRRPAVNGRVTGSITEWKGKFGWIVPDAPIMHPEARMKGGRIYMSQEDVLEVISGVGAEVSFYVYSDGAGLGALHVVPVDSATAKKKISKKVAMAPKPKAKAPVSTPGRNRIVGDLLKGTIKSWRGGFGFVIPAKPVDHPLFTGSVFLHGNDVTEPQELREGKKVSFYLYRDPQGLGAEECTILDDDDEEADAAMPASPMPPSSPVASTAVDLHESSGLLRAKPKGGAADGIMVARAKGGSVMKATPKAAAAVKAGDPELARKMAENPELAKQLSAWMFDAGG